MVAPITAHRVASARFGALQRRFTAGTLERVGQVGRIQKAFLDAGVKQAAMAGGIGRVRALAEARPDLGAVRIISKLRSFRDDALLRAVAADFESRGVTIIAPTDFLGEVLV